MAEVTDSGNVRLGVIGLGGRGRSLIRTLLHMDDVDITALCDKCDERLREAGEQVVETGRDRPDGYRNHHQMLARDDLQGVIVSTGWASHISLSIDVMKAGLYAAPEVGGASSLEECWELVRTSEETGMPCMLLENCCYGRDELAVLNMVKKGLFGELIHSQCGYQHDLRSNLVTGPEKGHYRGTHHIHRNGDLYPTHGLGPVANWLDINRGNRFLTLTSMASKARGLKEWATENLEQEDPRVQTDFAKGDIVTTMIRCARGETVMIIHDTSLARPDNSKGRRLQGIAGLWMQDQDAIYIEGQSPEHTWECFEGYRKEYEHPLWKEFIDEGVRGGHGGKDYLTLRALVESIRNNEETPIDAYDTAAWMAVTVLSEHSIARGSIPVDFPDFTNGRWIRRNPGPKSRYSLQWIP